MSIEPQVAAYYTRGKLEEKILSSLQAAGKNPTELSSADLALLDNFHVGGLESTEALAAQMELRKGMHLLDVGSGVGGPARYFAEHGCEVTGLDLTAEFVQVAASLTRMLKLDGKVKFQQGSALEMPFESGTFDGAYMIHVGMNIQDKAGVFREVARVLKHGARFAIFDIMGKQGDGLEFPLPWAVSPKTSFVASAEHYRQALEATGFHIVHHRDCRQFALDFMRKMMERAAAGTMPVLGVHLLMGEQAPVMLKNVMKGMMSGMLEPVELVARTN